MTDYTLPPLVTADGEFEIVVRSSYDTLTTPTMQTVIQPGKVDQSAFDTLNSQNVGTLQLEIIDDYSDPAVPEGFWFKVFKDSQHEIRIGLTEVATKRFYFFGKADFDTINWDTICIVDGERVRTITATLKSSLCKLFEIATVDSFAAEVYNNYIQVVPTPGAGSYNGVISVRGLFSSLLVVAGLNATYDEDDTTFVCGSADLLFYSVDGDTPPALTIDNLYVPVTINDNYNTIKCDYWLGSDAKYLSKLMPDMQEFLSNLIKNFGLKVYIAYNYSTLRYECELRQNWRTFSDVITFPEEAISEKQGYTGDVNFGEAARVTELWDEDSFMEYTSAPSITATPGLSYDFDSINIFSMAHSGSTFDTAGNILLCSENTALIDGDDCPVPVRDIKFWSPTSEFYVTTIAGPHKMEEAIAGYNSHKFRYRWRKITRTYKGIAASDGVTSTFANIQTQRRVLLDDSDLERYYFANKVTIDPIASETVVEWIQENLNPYLS